MGVGAGLYIYDVS